MTDSTLVAAGVLSARPAVPLDGGPSGSRTSDAVNELDKRERSRQCE
jgi:hypothetical protein